MTPYLEKGSTFASHIAISLVESSDVGKGRIKRLNNFSHVLPVYACPIQSLYIQVLWLLNMSERDKGILIHIWKMRKTVAYEAFICRRKDITMQHSPKRSRFATTSVTSKDVAVRKESYEKINLLTSVHHPATHGIN